MIHAVGAIDWGLITVVAGAVAAVCAAITGVGGILLAIRLWWLHRGKDDLKNWVHETSGSADVAREVRSARDSFNAGLEELKRIQDEHHSGNQMAISAVSGATERVAVDLRTFVDEHMIEAQTRDAAIARLNETQATIAATLAQVAAALGTHDRSRRKHPSPTA